MVNFLSKVIGEFLGVFIFFLAIFTNVGNNVNKSMVISLALFLAICLIGPVTGGHFNLTVSLVKYIAGEIDISQLGGYGAGQLLGGLAALFVSRNLTNKLQ